MAFERVLLLNMSGSSGVASVLTVVLLPSANAGPGIRECNDTNSGGCQNSPRTGHDNKIIKSIIIDI